MARMYELCIFWFWYEFERTLLSSNEFYLCGTWNETEAETETEKDKAESTQSIDEETI